MSEELPPGISVDEESNEIVFDYDELDEASQKTIDNLFAYLKGKK